MSLKNSLAALRAREFFIQDLLPTVWLRDQTLRMNALAVGQLGIIESSGHSERECRSGSDFCQPPQLRLGLGLPAWIGGPVSAGTDC